MLSKPIADAQPEELLHHYLNGDRQICAYLLLDPHYQKTVERIARKQTRGTAVPWEDAVQAAQSKVLQMLQAGKFYAGGLQEFYRWTATVARFEIIDLVRREVHRTCISLDGTLPGTTVRLSETIADPFDAMETVERSDVVLRAIEAIVKLDRQFPDRAYYQLWQGRVLGKSQTQIAAELGLTQGTVSKRWTELVRRLIDALGLMEIHSLTLKPSRDQQVQRSEAHVSAQKIARSRSQIHW